MAPWVNVVASSVHNPSIWGTLFVDTRVQGSVLCIFVFASMSSELLASQPMACLVMYATLLRARWMFFAVCHLLAMTQS